VSLGSGFDNTFVATRNPYWPCILSTTLEIYNFQVKKPIVPYLQIADLRLNSFLKFYMDQISGMSSEQFLAFSVNNALCPNQVIPPGSVPSWPEPFGAVCQQNALTSCQLQLPLLTNNLFQENAGILADEVSRNTNPFFTFGNSFLANAPVEPWQFNVIARDNSSAAEIDPVRQKITTSLQQSSQLESPAKTIAARPATHGSEATLDQTFPQVAQKVIELAQRQIASFFQQPDVANQLALAFGQGADAELAKSASLQLPTIEVLPDSLLGKANGAYATSSNTIFLAHSLIAKAIVRTDFLCQRAILEKALVVRMGFNQC
jgi:hypothetical protein